MFFSVFFNTSDKNSNSQLSGNQVSWERPLWFHNSSIHFLWPCIHSHIHLVHIGTRDKPEVSEALGVWNFIITESVSYSNFLGGSDLNMTTEEGDTPVLLTLGHPPAERSDLMNVSAQELLLSYVFSLYMWEKKFPQNPCSWFILSSHRPNGVTCPDLTSLWPQEWCSQSSLSKNSANSSPQVSPQPDFVCPVS